MKYFSPTTAGWGEPPNLKAGAITHFHPGPGTQEMLPRGGGVGYPPGAEATVPREGWGGWMKGLGGGGGQRKEEKDPVVPELRHKEAAEAQD